MGDVLVNGRDGSKVQSVEEMAGRFSSELMTVMPAWKQRVVDHPSELSQLESDVHQTFSRGADLVVAGLIAITMKQAEFAASCEQTRRHYAQPLARGRDRTISVRLLGGLVVWIASLYCEPKRRLFGSSSSSDKVPGVYIELVQFGFGKGVSPGLQSRVARQAALSPSLELARQELERDGIPLDVKTVRRIAYQCGDGLLRLRTHELMLWREGKLLAGSELHGKRVTVQIDGGRTKIRGNLRHATEKQAQTDADGLPAENAPGRSKQRARSTFDADWREPKLVTIFVHDERGRMEKASKATMDGSFLGPDALAELVAMHLHRLGAAHALSVTFVSDGAPWIWDRLPKIVKMADLEHVTTHEVLDCCHAAHHISLALAAYGLNEAERMPHYRQLRTLLRNGQWREVVEQLTDLCHDTTNTDKIRQAMQTEITYVRKHGEAGRLAYPHFRRLGLPLGSGAIESSIRRVINMRLKSNGMFWRQENAESMLQIRAQVISDRWDDRLRATRRLARHDARTAWEWTPKPMSIKSEGAGSTSD